MSVEPYWELTFDADGDARPGDRDALIRGSARTGLTDLVVFAHGWNNERSTATRLYDRFFAPFPGLLGGAGEAGGARVGYAGVFWPSMRFADEPVPDFPEGRVAAGCPPVLDPDTRRALIEILPCPEAVADRLAELLADRPEDRASLDEFVGLARGLADTAHEEHGGDLGDVPGDTLPAMLTDDARRVCESFTAALASVGALPPELFGGGPKKLWHGAHELLRQTSYYTMKRRAGTVGQAGLGPLLGELARSAPGLRVHLAGHSFGARLVSFALRGLPADTACVASLTLLQGAFSHYAFAPRLPFASDRGGALGGLHRRVRGPVVCCHSRHDTALGVLYPLASRMSGDDGSLLGLDDSRWGALGHGGIRAVGGCARLSLREALGGGLPADGCVNVDASAVVARGGPPSGAHSDICHPELARTVLLAGRLVR
ncbi:serine-threonine protein kinase [Streptomyces eurocidicus]|nr:serine-threonine protein kinase [Streptomyces eurocidicus]PNE30054.1 serine-threonine protein kinase [Streptomyces eurocidicus]